ncbi:energy transducer TonB [Sphingomonas morindae]|uniref:Energy transducer TonB n=1 Tax=Sphingomonas morindae TaxID=1541170 RepID=A0ABY4X9N9_9SPHN|nr:energy transducer TonB [Sphingomonas morindae]USI73657.1 energy transducer TonB [Sphingomonas morindae]
MYSELARLDDPHAAAKFLRQTAAGGGDAPVLGEGGWRARSSYAPPRAARPAGALGALAIVAVALALIFWTARARLIPAAPPARATRLLRFDLPGAAPPSSRNAPARPDPPRREGRPEAARTSDAAAPAPVAQPAPAQAAATTGAPPAFSSGPAREPGAPATAPPAVAPETGTAAAQDGAAAQADAAEAAWLARLLGRLQQFRRYPRAAESAGQQGVVTVAILVSREGSVLGVELRRPSGYPLLDMEALATVRRAAPLPPPDAAIRGDPVRVEVPVRFSLDAHRS